MFTMAKKKKPVALYHRRLETLRKANELSYRLAVRKWWLIQNKQIRKDLNQMIKKDVTADLTDWEFIEQEGERILSPVTLKIVQSGEEAAYATMNVKGSFSLVNVASVKAAKEFTAELVREVTEATKSGIRHAISEGIAEGKSMDKIARELKPMVGLTENQTRSVLNFRTDLEEKGKLSAAKIDKRTARFSEKVRTRRTKTIARTESGRAQNMGYVQGLKDVGVEEVEFSAYFDADEECLDLEGTKYKVDQAGGVIPVHPNCRCAMLPVVDDVVSSAIKNPPTPAELNAGAQRDLLRRLDKPNIKTSEARKLRSQLRLLGHKGDLLGTKSPVVVTPKPVPPKLPMADNLDAKPKIAPKVITPKAPKRRRGSFKTQQKEWVGGLSDVEVEDLRNYTKSYGPTNATQRKYLTGELKVSDMTAVQKTELEYISRIEKLIDDAPTYKGEIYRGMDFDPNSKEWLSFKSRLSKGKEFSFGNVQSFTTDYDVATFFSTPTDVTKKNVRVKIIMEKAPKRSALIKDVSWHPDENEILVGSGGKYKVTSVLTKELDELTTQYTYLIE